MTNKRLTTKAVPSRWKNVLCKKTVTIIIIYRVLIKFPILKSSTRYGTQYKKTVDHIRIIISSALHSCVHFIQIKECARDTGYRTVVSQAYKTDYSNR